MFRLTLEESEEDSGDEDEERNVNHLSGRQLEAEAVAVIQSKTGTIRLGEISDDEEDNIPLSELQRKINNKNVINRTWKKSIDLPQSFAPFVSPKQPQNIPSDPFEPYQGKQTNRQNMDLGVRGSVVMNLASKLPNNVSFKIYSDRYFSSLKLANRLQQLGYGYTGTIMSNRLEKCSIISTKSLEKLERRAYDYLTDTKNCLTVTAWNDNRAVLTVSSCHSVEPIKQVSRWISSKKKKLPVSQPNVIFMYNKYMGGVDRMNENIDKYRVCIKSKRWWWVLFTFCLDTAVHNAWQLHRKYTSENTKLDYLHFRRIVVQAYLQLYGTSAVGGGRPKTPKAIGSRVPDAVRKFDPVIEFYFTSVKFVLGIKSSDEESLLSCKLVITSSIVSVTVHRERHPPPEGPV
ncbi:hypothetical protein ILUMI_18069 [Ignelater luminosus]|uniref:PiggyBac transposable element-derived protein domain-containing protein n=1 Tax=Ignelater luminosus TaxID=2038154 RepID=A0A8K0G6R4_IGNLU|nr:hypothetical protein ILUMI_18069 [Ignelater luminosus]